MASDDEIQPILENEVPEDIKEEISETLIETSVTNHSNVVGDEDIEVMLTGCGASPFCDPRRMPHRFIALFLMCLLGFGSTFCYDNPGKYN